MIMHRRLHHREVVGIVNQGRQGLLGREYAMKSSKTEDRKLWQ